MLAVGLAVLAVCGTAAGMGSGPRLPAWVTDPAAAEQAYPRARYFVGQGVCGGASARDVMSREQAEAAAVADIAAVVEVQINDQVEQFDTTTERDGRERVDSVRRQTTRRVVTGLLSGVEVREVVFDPRSLNWHALAVLDRRQAGTGAVAAVERKARQVRENLERETAGPVDRFLALESLESVTEDLERLAVAVALFAPASAGAVRQQVDQAVGAVARERARVREAAAVRLELTGEAADGREALLQAARDALEQAGLSVRPDAAAVCRIGVKVEARVQMGQMRIVAASAGAWFELEEGGRSLLQGEVAADPAHAVRAAQREQAVARAVDGLAPRLRETLSRRLHERSKGAQP
jgi:hypothetical protein